MYQKTKNRIIYVCVIVAFLVTLLTACGGVSQELYQPVDAAVSEKNFDEAVEHIITAQRQEGRRRIYNEKNVISMWLDKGLLEHYAGNWQESATSLGNAEKAIEEAFTKSITAEVATYIANDNAREYPGEDFEDIYISVFNALNYYQMGSLDGALVEVRKLTMPNGKIDMLERKYEEANAKAKSENETTLAKLQGQEGASQLPEWQRVSFTSSALAHYLSVLFYQADGNADAIRIEYERLENAYPSQPNIYTHPRPRAFDNLHSFSDEEGRARVDILSFIGMSPIKVEQTHTLYFPFFQNVENRIVNIRLPELTPRPYGVNRVEIIVDGQSHEAEILEDIGNVITDTFNARYSTIFLKTFIRTMVKYATSDIASGVANRATQDKGDVAKGLALVGRIAARVAIEASERADIRMARYLPDKAMVSSFFVTPGRHNIVINYYQGNHLLYTEYLENTEIKPHSLNLLNTTFLDYRRPEERKR